MNKNSPSKPNQIRKSWANRLLYGGVFLVCLLALMAFLILNFGFVRGTQLNPFTLDERGFSYVRLPPSNMHIYPVTYRPKSSSIADYLAKEKILSSVNIPTDSSWHVISASSGTTVQTGDAKILIDFLEQRAEDNKLFWVEWSEKHPQEAKAFWPLVSEVAQKEAYLIIPDLFEIAKNQADSPSFAENVRARLAEFYASLASDYKAAAEFEHAIDLLTAAIEHDSKSKYYEIRADCFDAVDNTEKADEDRIEAANAEPET